MYVCMYVCMYIYIFVLIWRRNESFFPSANQTWQSQKEMEVLVGASSMNCRFSIATFVQRIPFDNLTLQMPGLKT